MPQEILEIPPVERQARLAARRSREHHPSHRHRRAPVDADVARDELDVARGQVARARPAAAAHARAAELAERERAREVGVDDDADVVAALEDERRGERGLGEAGDDGGGIDAVERGRARDARRAARRARATRARGGTRRRGRARGHRPEARRDASE